MEKFLIFFHFEQVAFARPVSNHILPDNRRPPTLRGESGPEERADTEKFQ